MAEKIERPDWLADGAYAYVVTPRPAGRTGYDVTRVRVSRATATQIVVTPGVGAAPERRFRRRGLGEVGVQLNPGELAPIADHRVQDALRRKKVQTAMRPLIAEAAAALKFNRIGTSDEQAALELAVRIRNAAQDAIDALS